MDYGPCVQNRRFFFHFSFPRSYLPVFENFPLSSMPRALVCGVGVEGRDRGCKWFSKVRKVQQSLIPLIVLLNGVTPRCQNLGLLEGPEGHGRPPSRQRFGGTSGTPQFLANLIKNHKKGAEYSRRGTRPAALLPELERPRLESLYVTIWFGGIFFFLP
jgi:hypothetical protein